MLILVGPSASGKTEVANILINKYQMKRMVTYTTRPIRVGEANGISYNFVTVDEFLDLKSKNEFVESVCYNNNWYGTRRSDVSDDKIVILEPNGFQAFYKEMPNEIVSFYLQVGEVERINRMIYRQDKQEDIEKRIQNDREVFQNIPNIDYCIANEDITLVELADKIYKLYKDKIRRF